MKTMNPMRMQNRMQMRMRMQESYCCMMAMTMKEGIYIIGINKVKKKKHEKISISNSSIIEYQRQQHLGN